MKNRTAEALSVSDVIKDVRAALSEQRARVFVFFTEAHRKLSHSHETFQFAMSQADHCFAADKESGTPFTSQKELLDALANLAGTSKCKLALLAGPDKVARDLAHKLEKAHPGFSEITAIDLPKYYDTDEDVTGHVIEALNRASPDIVLMSSGLRTQEIWIANYRHRLNCSVVMGLH